MNSLVDGWLEVIGAVARAEGGETSSATAGVMDDALALALTGYESASMAMNGGVADAEAEAADAAMSSLTAT